MIDNFFSGIDTEREGERERGGGEGRDIMVFAIECMH